MTNLFLQRLIVLKGESEIYNEKFHKGINVISGEHAVGKSTIMDLIFFVLGGVIKKDNWLYPANQCDCVVAEVFFNKTLFTLKRPIQIDAIPPISIKESPYNIKSEWMTFGSRRTENRKSFSEQIFELLSWGNHKTDDYANLTMHQILRMLYIDQESDSLKLFRTESTNADSESTRLAIAEFLLGLDDLETYEVRQNLLRKQKELDKTKDELNAIKYVLGKDSSYTNLSLDEEIENLYASINSINNDKIELLQSTEKMEINDNSETIKVIKSSIDEIALTISNQETLQSQLSTEIIDCEGFKKNLNFRKKSLLESNASTEAFGFVKFINCPSCRQKIEHIEENETCPLCKSEQTQDNVKDTYLEVLTELQFQEKQNQHAIEQFELHLEALETDLKTNYKTILLRKNNLREIMSYSTLREQELTELSKNIGFIEAQIETLLEKKEIISKLNSLRDNFIKIESKINQLYVKLDQLEEKNKAYKQSVLNSISNDAKNIIESDLDYEELFKDASLYDDEIDFKKDRWLIDGRVKFSGSSNLIKKNSFHLACLYNSLKNRNFRYPRFLIIDDIENGGMKPERSKNFQKNILNLLKDQEEFQLIIATAMIDETLDKENYAVGRYYEKEDYILKI